MTHTTARVLQKGDRLAFSTGSTISKGPYIVVRRSPQRAFIKPEGEEHLGETMIMATPNEKGRYVAVGWKPYESQHYLLITPEVQVVLDRIAQRKRVTLHAKRIPDLVWGLKPETLNLLDKFLTDNFPL